VQISSRKVMQQVLLQNGVPPEAFSPVCVIVDKVDKIGKEKVDGQNHATCCMTCKAQRTADL
jgi:histidyl-tRNA synthetase